MTNWKWTVFTVEALCCMPSWNLWPLYFKIGPIQAAQSAISWSRLIQNGLQSSWVLPKLYCTLYQCNPSLYFMVIANEKSQMNAMNCSKRQNYGNRVTISQSLTKQWKDYFFHHIALVLSHMESKWFQIKFHFLVSSGLIRSQRMGQIVVHMAQNTVSRLCYLRNAGLILCQISTKY